MIFFIFLMGCRSENNIKEEIVGIETIEEKTKLNSKLTIQVPEVSEDPKAIEKYCNGN